MPLDLLSSFVGRFFAYLDDCLIRRLPKGPLSEIFGRSKVLQISNIWFLGVSDFLGSLLGG